MLSDVCSDTLNNMAEDLVNYSDFGYCPKQISIFVDAMYSLAKLGFQLDTPPSVVHPNPKLVVHLRGQQVLDFVRDREEREIGCCNRLLQQTPVPA